MDEETTRIRRMLRRRTAIERVRAWRRLRRQQRWDWLVHPVQRWRRRQLV